MDFIFLKGANRLSKRQSLSTTTVLFRTMFTRTIKLNLLLKMTPGFKPFTIYILLLWYSSCSSCISNYMIFIMAMVVKTCKWCELGILQWRILLGVCKLTTIGNNTCYYCYIEGDRLFFKKNCLSVHNVDENVTNMKITVKSRGWRWLWKITVFYRWLKKKEL